MKYMGHRIELEEIQRAVASLPGVDRCCCVFHREKQRIYGFYTGDLPKKELHRQLGSLLPVYMIPGAFYNIPQFPLTKNGKIDRELLLKRRDSYDG